MDDLTSTSLPGAVVAHDKSPQQDARISAFLIVLGASLLLLAVALSRSFYNGRLASPMTHNDVNYFVQGLQHLTILRTKGFFALVADFLHSSLHAPFSTYQATFAYLIFGITDWAPYVSNLVFVLIFLGFAAYLLRGSPAVVLMAAMASLIGMPLASNTITEFAPELVCSLFTSIAAILMVRQSVIEAKFSRRFRAGLCFGLGFLAHPSAFAFTAIALLATVGVAFLRDVVWPWELGKLRIGIFNSFVNILLSIWLPALYMIPRYREYWQYFYDALFNPATQWIWVAEMGFRQHLRFYLFGPGGQFMFAHQLWIYAGIIGLGSAAASLREDRRFLARQIELLVLALIFWLIPTLAVVKVSFFASTFGYLIAFMTAMALGSIYQTTRGTTGALAVSGLGFYLLVADWFQLPIPNIPRTIVDREYAFRAIDRLKVVLLENAADYHNTKVYMTNIGAYAPNILQYYLLKTDPTLEWTFNSLWTDPDPRHHIKFIHESRQDFVVAEQRDNGFTYSNIAWPAEDPVFAAMWQDRGYMAIDRFYGPKGREIAIFQRRKSFGGWRPIWGIVNPSKTEDDPRYSPEGLVHLEAFAAHPIQAQLKIKTAGTKAGQKLDVFVNHQSVGEWPLGMEDQPSSLGQEISLTEGTNDIVLQSDGPLVFRRLLIVQGIVPDGLNHGIFVDSATYGGNCGVLPGNATADVIASCQGAINCSYPVQLERLGDPAPGCGKDFVVSYSCAPDETILHKKLPAEASVGGTLDLSCAPPEKN